MGQIQSHRGILQTLCVYNSDKGVIHNEWKGFRPAYMIRQELHLTVWQRIKRVFL